MATIARQAKDEDRPKPGPWSLHWQMTYNLLWHAAFPSPYSGANTFQSRYEGRGTVTSTFFVGRHLWKGAAAYVNVETAGGEGLSGALGLLSPPNGESYRVGSPSLKTAIVRAYIRQSWVLGGRPAVLENDLNQVQETDYSRRFDLVAGKFCLTDFFDNNAYAGDPRTQFNSWSLWANAAWDYPADTRGYTWGLMLELVWDRWAVRVASAMEPAVANGMSLDHRVSKAHGEVLEVARQYTLSSRPGVVRALLYENHADMGSYREALLLKTIAPDVTATRSSGRAKWGAGLNLEQAMADHVGCFLRAGWNDGKTESWAFAEVDRTLSGGISLDGTAWGRPQDHVGAGMAINGLSKDHRRYLAAGGLGFILGDGRLAYAPERLIDAYYSRQVFQRCFISGEVQHFTNLGANGQRGHVTVYGIRIHFEF